MTAPANIHPIMADITVTYGQHTQIISTRPPALEAVHDASPKGPWFSFSFRIWKSFSICFHAALASASVSYEVIGWKLRILAYSRLENQRIWPLVVTATMRLILTLIAQAKPEVE